MKAKAIHVDPSVVVEMSLTEARVLRALAASVNLAATGVVTRAVQGLAVALHDAGVSALPNAFKGKLDSMPITEVEK